MKTITLINEDGTSRSDFPKNPLEEKWNKLFPKKGVCHVLEENNVVNYGCLNCSKCPEGDLFTIPKEDLEEYKRYLQEVKKYDEKHNTEISKILSYKINEDNI